MTRATNGANIVNFDYDAIGNITRKSDVHAGTNSYLYHATKEHALTAVGSPATPVVRVRRERQHVHAQCQLDHVDLL